MTRWPVLPEYGILPSTEAFAGCSPQWIALSTSPLAPMTEPNIVGKNALFVEAREAVAVRIIGLREVDGLVLLDLELSSNVPHKRSWRAEVPYVPNDKPWGDRWTVSCAKDTITLRDDFAQGPQAGWQLLIDSETVAQFLAQDDAWVSDWF